MWQRKQTFFLVVVGVGMTASIFFPVWRGAEEGQVLFPMHYSVTVQGVLDTVYYPYASVAILAIASATLVFIEIGKFRDRPLQLKLGALNSLCMASSMGLGVYFATDLIKSNQVAGQYGISLFLPALSMISNMVANWFIRRDERMVKNADNLR